MGRWRWHFSEQVYHKVVDGNHEQRLTTIAIVKTGAALDYEEANQDSSNQPHGAGKQSETPELPVELSGQDSGDRTVGQEYLSISVSLLESLHGSIIISRHTSSDTGTGTGTGTSTGSGSYHHAKAESMAIRTLS